MGLVVSVSTRRVTYGICHVVNHFRFSDRVKEVNPVFIRAGNDCERRCEQLFRQRPPASDNIDRTVQVNGRILPLFTWSSAPVVSYYGPLLSSSKGERIQPENRQLAKSSTSTPQSAATRLPRCGLTPSSHPFLLIKTITTNNYRGIPPRYREAVIIAVGRGPGGKSKIE